MKNIARILVAAAIVAVPAVLVTKTNAVAAPAPEMVRFHLALSKSEPAKNDTVASPKAIKLWFSQTVKATGTGVQITAPDKHVVATGAITIGTEAKAPAVAEIKETLKPGTYTVEWKTLAEDGHPNKGTFAFTVGTKHAQ